MAEVHVTITDKSGVTIVAHNPAVRPLPAGAGQAVSQTKDANGKVVKTAGQVAGTTCVHVNPA
jgi:hypothetical protein